MLCNTPARRHWTWPAAGRESRYGQDAHLQAAHCLFRFQRVLCHRSRAVLGARSWKIFRALPSRLADALALPFLPPPCVRRPSIQCSCWPERRAPGFVPSYSMARGSRPAPPIYDVRDPRAAGGMDKSSTAGRVEVLTPPGDDGAGFFLPLLCSSISQLSHTWSFRVLAYLGQTTVERGTN
jgi:hypothetical protein